MTIAIKPPNSALASMLSLGLLACGGGAQTVPPSSNLTSISALQGSGQASPLEGQQVTIRAIVSGDFQDNDDDTLRNLGGFYVQQDEDDGDPHTSAGVFVFEGKEALVDISTGDRVQVSGLVTEHFGETQIKASSVTVIGSGQVQTTDISLPTASYTMNSDGQPLANLEQYEGMLVRFPQTLRVTNLRNLERFGEVGLSAGERPVQFTNANKAGESAYRLATQKIATRSLILDDGMRASNPSELIHLNAGAAADYSIRSGDSSKGSTGNLRYSRSQGGRGDEAWRLMPVVDIQFESDNPRPDAPRIDGDIKVASLNVLNFFSSVDNGSPSCGPQRDQNCRGADTALELTRQLEKIVTALVLMDADIIGLIELENDADAAISTIVNSLNRRLGSAQYGFIDTGEILDDAIKTGFLYRSLTIAPLGSFALLTSSEDSRFDITRHRPALAQTFRALNSGAVLTVVVNHFKSKGSSCDDGGDPNIGDGQGNCNQTRNIAAAALADWISTDPTASGDDDFLIIGDLNAYALEDPLLTFRNAGFTNLLAAEQSAYSYVYDGKTGALDHALANVTLKPQVVAAMAWHINADEPALLDYNLENGRDASLFDPKTPYRASDHDPIIIGLDLAH